MSLEDVLSDTQPEPVVEPVVEAVEPVKAEPVVAEPPPEPKPEPTPEPAKEPSHAQEFTEREKAFLAKANDEKQKRQELERMIAEIKASQTKSEAPPADAPKEFWEDPEGALKRHEENMSRIAANTRINTSETIARSKHADFDDKMAIFGDLVKQSPFVAQQMINAPDPAEFAYSMAKNHHDLKTAGNLDSLRAQIEAETRAKVEAEFKAKQEAKVKALNDIPESLSTTRSTGVNKPVWGGPESLDNILHS